MSNITKAPGRGRPASMRSADNSGEEYGPISYARRSSSSHNNPSVPKAPQPKASAKAKAKGQNSLGISPAAVRKWLAEEPASNTTTPATNNHKRKPSNSATSPLPSSTPLSTASSRRGSRSGSLDVTVRAEFGSLEQSMSSNNNEVLPFSTSRAMHSQLQAIADRILAAGGSSQDVDAFLRSQRRGSGSSGARRSSLVEIEAGNGYFDIKRTSAGIDPNPSTPLGPPGRAAHSVYNNSTPGGTNSSREEMSQTPGGSKLWTRHSTQRMSLNMPVPFHLNASLRRSKKPSTPHTPATAMVDSSAAWASVNVS